MSTSQHSWSELLTTFAFNIVHHDIAGPEVSDLQQMPPPLGDQLLQVGEVGACLRNSSWLDIYIINFNLIVTLLIAILHIAWWNIAIHASPLLFW